MVDQGGLRKAFVKAFKSSGFIVAAVAIESGALPIPSQSGHRHPGLPDDPSAHTSHRESKAAQWVFELPKSLLNGPSFTVEGLLCCGEAPGLPGPGRGDQPEGVARQGLAQEVDP